MSRAIYWFRNIRTKQVFATMERSVLANPRLIKGQIPVSQLPSKIRPDHWTPLVVAHGFESDRSHTDVFTLATQPGHPLAAQTQEQKDKYRLLPNVVKRKQDMDMIERQIAQMARTMVYLDKTESKAVSKDSPVTLFWEDDEWVGKVEEAGLQWPEWIRHGRLELKRGNIILNQELRTAK
ncbi:hypothetical protein IWW50_006668 [Coemansia erecta]|nr:hypothetical protein GGF43_006364 [Coemansia sp. RSA 2618]KAJ2815931.1 hypothetical protein IWW50_006668 [Coemansia erecta]